MIRLKIQDSGTFEPLFLLHVKRNQPAAPLGQALPFRLNPITVFYCS